MSLKPIRNVCKQVYAKEKPAIPYRNFETNGRPYDFAQTWQKCWVW